MKYRNPKTREDLSIKNSYRVLEIGGGNFPHNRAHVVVDKFVDSNYHRSGNVKVWPHQQFVVADGANLPFSDNEFDYVICCHVLEHVDDPISFLKEQSRIAKMGYIETPSIIGEYLMPKESHKWLLQEIDGKIIMYEKSKIGFTASQDLSYVFLNYLPKQSIGYKIMQRTHSHLTNVVYEWKDEIEVLVNPDDPYYLDFFTKPWDDKKCTKLLSKNGLKAETLSSVKALLNIIKSSFQSKLLKRKSKLRMPTMD